MFVKKNGNQLKDKMKGINCNKTVFFTSQDAHERVQEINQENSIIGREERLRHYKCDNCGYYHLTSMKKHDYKKKNDGMYRKKLQFKSFLRRESEYWKGKLGV